MSRRRWWAARRTSDGLPPADEPGSRTDDGRESRWDALRERMVRDQLLGRGIDDAELLGAFRAVPRHVFVASDDAYADRALGIGSGQSISQPYVVASMLRLARPRGGWPDATVLEIGTGSGYGAAVLAELGARVVTIERHASLAATAREALRAAGYDAVRVVVGDGSSGFPAGAPFDAILVTAAGPSVPRPLVDQLSEDGGRLVMPVGTRDQQWLTVVERHGSVTSQRAVEPVVFVPLLGEHGFRSA